MCSTPFIRVSRYIKINYSFFSPRCEKYNSIQNPPGSLNSKLKPSCICYDEYGIFSVMCETYLDHGLTLYFIALTLLVSEEEKCENNS